MSERIDYSELHYQLQRGASPYQIGDLVEVQWPDPGGWEGWRAATVTEVPRDPSVGVRVTFDAPSPVPHVEWWACPANVRRRVGT